MTTFCFQVIPTSYYSLMFNLCFVVDMVAKMQTHWLSKLSGSVKENGTTGSVQNIINLACSFQCAHNLALPTTQAISSQTPSIHQWKPPPHSQPLPPPPQSPSHSCYQHFPTPIKLILAVWHSLLLPWQTNWDKCGQREPVHMQYESCLNKRKLGSRPVGLNLDENAV